MKYPALCVAFCISAAAAGQPGQARAQSVDRPARAWAASCATCHGTDGRAQGGGIPSIAGRSADDLLRTLLEFKNGQRPAATVMHQNAKGYTDDELRRIAQVLAAAPAP
jgi:cytochrome c553